ncbi:hypothetical protein GCM10022198_02250 [Klugiella xanthotipulae]|uniref:Htaa protein n=1 Tax=Klugiella xanthotipulae TaxID=244735 RepID=A0A543I4Z9_9MICO|nr:HtaA domain-containing protein [Klugiella xanthotipulae]TQM65639.1 Htaa protein [Klugiella xanthotipulae]
MGAECVRDRQGRTPRGRTWGLVALLLASGGFLSAMGMSAPLPAVAETAETGCPVSAGTLTWGVKESFRAYISGTIANGSWEVADGATYTTPTFGWSNPAGGFSEKTGSGTASFTGSIRFTGHDDILNLTLANPQIEVVSPTEAYLLLDLRSNDPEGNESVRETAVRAATLELTAPLEISSGNTVTRERVAATLTEPGVVAFAEFYEQGADLDPLNFSLTFGPCPAASEAPGVAPSAMPGNLENDTPTTSPPFGIWVLVGGVLIGGGAAVIVWRRRARR